MADEKEELTPTARVVETGRAQPSAVHQRQQEHRSDFDVRRLDRRVPPSLLTDHYASSSESIIAGARPLTNCSLVLISCLLNFFGGLSYADASRTRLVSGQNLPFSRIFGS